MIGRKKLRGFGRIWVAILIIVFSLFFITGVVMIAAGREFFFALQFIISAILFFIAVTFYFERNPFFLPVPSPVFLFFILGFLFQLAGMIFHGLSNMFGIIIWGLGVAMFVFFLSRNHPWGKKQP